MVVVDHKMSGRYRIWLNSIEEPIKEDKKDQELFRFFDGEEIVTRSM